MPFYVKMTENGRKMISGGTQTTTKLPVMILNGKVLKEGTNHVFEVL